MIARQPPETRCLGIGQGMARQKALVSPDELSAAQDVLGLRAQLRHALRIEADIRRNATPDARRSRAGTQRKHAVEFWHAARLLPGSSTPGARSEKWKEDRMASDVAKIRAVL